MDTIQITKKNAAVAYNNADAKGKKILEDLLGKDNLVPIKITDRVKTSEDVLDVLGGTSSDVKDLLTYKTDDPDVISSRAHLKLTLIARALNEGWTPDWTNSSQYKYMPWFKQKSGFGLAFDVCDHWHASTGVGSRLCFKSVELAEYAATQFADIYNDFLTIK